MHTALLSCCVRYMHSPVLLKELVHFLLGSDTRHEQRTDAPPHTHMLRYHLIEHCDHISDEVPFHILMVIMLIHSEVTIILTFVFIIAVMQWLLGQKMLQMVI